MTIIWHFHSFSHRISIKNWDILILADTLHITTRHIRPSVNDGNFMPFLWFLDRKWKSCGLTSFLANIAVFPLLWYGSKSKERAGAITIIVFLLGVFKGQSTVQTIGITWQYSNHQAIAGQCELTLYPTTFIKHAKNNLKQEMNFNFQTDILGDEQMLDSTRYITSKGNHTIIWICPSVCPFVRLLSPPAFVDRSPPNLSLLSIWLFVRHLLSGFLTDLDQTIRW